jgi:hypothetical protein
MNPEISRWLISSKKDRRITVADAAAAWPSADTTANGDHHEMLRIHSVRFVEARYWNGMTRRSGR